MQDQLVEWFGSTGGGRALIIALVVLVVLVCWLILPRVWNAMVGGSGLRSIRNRQPRLAVMDVAAVDNRRRLVLIRRDNVEHLILIGGPSDLVVEQTIIKGVPVGTTAGRVPRPPQTFDVPPSVSERAAERAEDDRPAPERSGDRSGVDRRGSRASDAVSEAAATVRALRPTTEPSPVSAPAAAEPKPAEARRPMARPVSPLQSAPSHPAPVTSGSAQPAASAMAQTALTPSPVSPPPAPTPAPAPVVADAPAPPAKPYVPPAPSRPAARQEPIATPPIVAEPTVAAPEVREPVAAAPAPREPAAPAAKEPAVPFDDLAARLDEALRLDIEQPRTPAPAPARAPVAPASTSYARPTRGPAAGPGPLAGSGPAATAPVPPTPVPPTPVPPVVAAPPAIAAEPVTDRPEPVDLEPPAPRSPLASASTWFRPRANPTPAPARVEPARLEPSPASPAEPTSAGPERVRLEPEAMGLRPVADMPADGPDFPKVEPDALSRTDGPVAAVLPAVEPRPVRADIGSTLADDLARILVEEPNAGSRRPEPTINFAEELAEPAPDAAPPVVVDKPTPKETARADDFTSLEDEMARLLDELAGDSNRSSRS